MNEQNETTLRYTYPVQWAGDEIVDYSAEDMRQRDLAAEYARNMARYTYPAAGGIHIVSVNRGPRNYVVRVSVVR